MPFGPINQYQFICDDCEKVKYYNNVKDARAHRWAVSKDYRKCYCPDCALAHRNVGRYGAGHYLKPFCRKV